MVLMLSYMILSLMLFHKSNSAKSPGIHLDYTSYRGTELSNSLTQWLVMRYSAPPLGGLRFREPQDPLPKRRVVDADAYGPYCLGTAAGLSTLDMNEDCLFLNVWAPSSASTTSRLPVYVFIQRGGLNSNTKANNG